MTLLFLNLGTTELLIVLPLIASCFYSLFHTVTNMTMPGTHRLIRGGVDFSGSLARQHCLLGCRTEAGKSNKIMGMKKIEALNKYN